MKINIAKLTENKPKYVHPQYDWQLSLRSENISARLFCNEVVVWLRETLEELDRCANKMLLHTHTSLMAYLGVGDTGLGAHFLTQKSCSLSRLWYVLALFSPLLNSSTKSRFQMTRSIEASDRSVHYLNDSILLVWD